MKRTVVFSLAVFAVWGLYAQSDPVLMTVAGRKVLRSEFEYLLNKSGKVTEKEEIRKYADLYVNYRLKVQAALDARLDTISSFKKEYRFYRDAQLRTCVYDSVYADSVAHAVYDAMKESVGDSDIVQLSHIFLRVPQNSDDSFLEAQKNRADSICSALESGADFADLARMYSQDRLTADRGGMLDWVGPSQMVPEFRNMVYALKPGTFCRPFVSPAGVHIVYMHDRKRFGSFEEMRGDILKELNARGLQEDAAEHEINRMVSESGGTHSREDILMAIQSKAEKQNPSLKYLLAEYYDGLLLYEATNRMVWRDASNDEKGLEEFFDKHKNNYRWDSPRFRGYVVKARSKEMLSMARKVLKKCKAGEGVKLLKEKLPADSVKFISVHFGIYKNGDNQIVDKEVFKTVDKIKENRLFPYYEAIGMKIKQPKNVVDVKDAVLSDYQNFKEKDWVNSLRRKYSYTIDENVFSTINDHE